tara:strand:- start:43 stop:1734 length:1692 start_codon:yes stop_codon:yes gene_type:complete
MAINLKPELYDYVNDGNGELVAFPKGTPIKEQQSALQRRDPDYIRYEKDIANNPVFSIPDSNPPSFPEYKTFLSNQKTQTQEKESRTLFDKLKGAGETGLSIGSGLMSAIGSVPVWAGESAKDVVTGQPVESFETAFGDIMKAGTYQPRTTAGQEYVGDVADLIGTSKIEGMIGLSPVGKTMPMSLKYASKAKAPKVKAPKSEKGWLSEFFGMTTGSGGRPLKEAFEIAKKGTTEQIEAFNAAIKGNVNAQQTVSKAQDALRQIRKLVSIEYQANKTKLTKDKSVLNFDEIDESLIKIKEAGKFQGKVIKESTVKIQKEITDIVNKWKKLDPKKYHTPEGIDALKQKIGDLYDTTKPFTNERRVVQEVYGSLGKTIRKNAPIYDDMMTSYEQGKNLIREIEDTFSMGERGGKPKPLDTQFRKLQSIMRDNVNTNFGERFDLAKKLAELDPTLFPELSGQSLTSYVPKGQQRQVAAANALISLQQSFGGNMLPLLGLPFQSPRLMGEGAKLGGQIAKYGTPIRDAANRAIINPAQGLLSQGAGLAGEALRQPTLYGLLPDEEMK